VVNNPAKVDVFESHSGADTMATVGLVLATECVWYAIYSTGLTALRENVQALFDQEGGIEYDEAVGERKNIVTRADLEECANRTLSRLVSEMTSKLQQSRTPEDGAQTAGGGTYKTINLLLVQRSHLTLSV
jgi:hypothetical protein